MSILGDLPKLKVTNPNRPARRVDPSKIAGSGFKIPRGTDPSKIVGSGFKIPRGTDPSKIVGRGFRA